MAALRSRCGHYIFALWFLLLSFFYLFPSPNLSRHRLDAYHTSTHGVALVRIWDAGLKRAARGSLRIHDAKNRQNWPAGHHRTTLSSYIFATTVRIDNRKKSKLETVSIAEPLQNRQHARLMLSTLEHKGKREG